MEEKIIRSVTGIGNGAHIFAPKEWIGEEVALTRISRKNPKEEIIKLLYPYLDRIISVFLFGSYARNEQQSGSDMDVFVIASTKFSVKSKGMDIIVIPEKKIDDAKRINPVLFYSMLQEAKQIINPSYLEILKQEKINPCCFRDFIKETENSLFSSREIMNLDKKLKNKWASESVVYSALLRLRGIFIINLLLNKKAYSKKIFKEWVAKNSDADYDGAYAIYQAVRENKKSDKRISIEQAESLLSLLSKETEILSKKIK